MVPSDDMGARPVETDRAQLPTPTDTFASNGADRCRALLIEGAAHTVARHIPGFR
jgi:hypothetical protein